MNKTNQCVSFEGNVSDYKALLNAVDYALSFVQSANNHFLRTGSDKNVRLNFCICNGVVNVKVKVLDDPRSEVIK